MRVPTHLPSWLESEDSESSGNDNLLNLVLGRWDTLEQFQAFQSGGTTGGLVGDHSSDGLVEDPRWGAEVEGTGTGGVDNVALCTLTTATCYWAVSGELLQKRKAALKWVEGMATHCASRHGTSACFGRTSRRC